MANRADLLFRFLGEAKDLTSATRQAQTSLGKVDKAADKTGSKFKGMGKKIGTAALAIGGAAAIAGAAWAIEGAKIAAQADLVARAFDTTFGKAAKRLRDENEEIRKALGLSEQAFERLITPIGQLAKAKGLDSEATAELGQFMLRTAGDVAAFNGNLDQTEEVLNALAAAYRGEADPSERFGFALKQNDVNLKALELTGKSSVDMLTNLEKQTAITALIQEQMADETGALSAAMEAGATDGNTLTAIMTDLQTEVGKELVPVIRDLAGFLIENKDVIVGLANAMIVLIRWFVVGAGAIVNFDDTVRVWIGNVRLAGTIVSLLFGKLRSLISGALAPVGNAFASVARSIANVVSWFDRLKGRISRGLGRIRNPFSGFSLPRFHRGGVVPGAPGTEVPILAEAGETITPAGGAVGGAGSGGNTVVLEVDGKELGRVLMPSIVDDLRLGTGIRK